MKVEVKILKKYDKKSHRTKVKATLAPKYGGAAMCTLEAELLLLHKGRR